MQEVAFRDLGIALAADDLKVVTLRPQITEFLPPSLREAALGRMAGVGIPLVAAILTPGPVDDLALAAGAAGHATRSGSGQVLRHYTNEAGFKAIMESQMLRGPTTGKHAGRVFATELAANAARVEQDIFVGFSTHAGRGAYVIEFQTKPGVFFEMGKNGTELIHRGSLRFGRHIEINFAGPNAY